MQGVWRALIPLLGLAVIGCEREYGIHRSATLSTLPDLECIRSVVNETALISSVDENHWVSEEQGNDGLRRQSHRYSYQGPDVRGHLGIFVDPGGEIRFVQSYIRTDEKPPQTTIDRSLEAMREMARIIEVRCEVEDLVASIHESCERVECRLDRSNGGR